jgi:hypothetical protein
MFSYSTGYYVSPPDDQYLKFKNRCSLLFTPLTKWCRNESKESENIANVKSYFGLYVLFIPCHESCNPRLKIVKLVQYRGKGKTDVG